MGIPVYFKTCIETYDTICEPLESQPIDYLLFDFNCLIHPCCRNTTDESEMIQTILTTLNDLLVRVNPQKNVLIAIDGPCPKPKLLQQRMRRFKSALEKKPWDTNAITPGTRFMKQLEIQLQEFISQSSYSIQLSGSLEPGEGEHK